MTGAAGERPLRVLVVDDERLSRVTTTRQLQDAGFVADGVDNGYQALEALHGRGFDVVLCDLRMPGLDGIEVLERVRAEMPDVDVLLMTAYGTVETAVKAMQLGAADYLTKPFHFKHLEHRLGKLAELRMYRREVSRLEAMLGDDEAFGGIVGRSPGMVEVAGRIRTFTEWSAPVLITGETGTGKELVSRALHALSARARRPFVPVPCGAIPETLAESELFGHEKGAFTGATGQRHGAFERAHGGTLLLDDVDDLPPTIQVKLLRVLQEGTFVRVGGSRETHVDVRVIATTKVELAERVGAGAFRADLFYRLRGLSVHIPPLRERGEDLLLLAATFLRRSAEGAGRRLALSPEAAAVLRSYPWPGNVRELRHAMESCCLVCPGPEVLPAHLPEFLRDGEGGEELFTLRLAGRESVAFADVVHRFEDQLIRWAMERAGGQQTRAAELLGLPRTTFQSKLQR
ncbi:MAG: sigma-54-dependent Fis family transcriptional regulator [Myxococcales bacterium]